MTKYREILRLSSLGLSQQDIVLKSAQILDNICVLIHLKTTRL